jgi:uridine kinase
MSKPLIIAIGGPSGSGKSYLAQHLAQALPDSSVLSLDSYYREFHHLGYAERCELNFDHPDSIDTPLLIAQMETLAQGWPIKRPVYDFETHARHPLPEPFLPRRYVILEGIFALYFARVRQLALLKVFVQTPDSQCFDRRLARDTVERGRSAASVSDQYTHTVRPMAYEYIWPTRHYANVIIPGNQPIAHSVDQVLSALPQLALAAAG